jgi:hypothetical protein
LNPQLRRLLMLSVFVATLAFAVPWLTHFADRGFSVGMVLLWFGLLIVGLIQHRLRGLWLLTSAPMALFWPIVLLVVFTRDDFYLGF